MFVAVLRFELFVPESASLKSKRMVLNSIKQRIRNKFNVSVAEIDNNDKWQRISLGVSMISNERKFIEKAMSEIVKMMDNDNRIEILKHLLEFY